MNFRLSTGTRPDANPGQVESMKTNLSWTIAFTDPFGNGTGSGSDGIVPYTERSLPPRKLVSAQ